MFFTDVLTFVPMLSDLIIEICRTQRIAWPVGDGDAATFRNMPLN